MSIWGVFESLIRGRGEPPVRPIPGHQSALPPRDDDFVATLEPLPVDIDGVSIGILYRDASGTASSRTIRCHQALRSVDDLLYLHAWCLQRQDWRTFRLDRIVEVYDYTTGELLGRAAPFFSQMLGVPISDPMADAAAPAAFRDGGRVLLFVAMGDGELHPAEMKVVVDFAVDRMRLLTPTVAAPDRIARLWMGNQVPTRQAALTSLRKIADDDGYARAVADKMINVMIADGEVKDAEMDAAWAIVKGLERAEKRQGRTRP